MSTKKILSEEHFAAIPRLIQSGLNKRQIAAQLGCKASTLQVRCSQRKISLRTIDGRAGNKAGNKNGRNLRVNAEIIQLYEREAAERGISTRVIVQRLLEIIAKDNLFNAVLDEPDQSWRGEDPSWSSLEPMAFNLKYNSRKV